MRVVINRLIKSLYLLISGFLLFCVIALEGRVDYKFKSYDVLIQNYSIVLIFAIGSISVFLFLRKKSVVLCVSDEFFYGSIIILTGMLFLAQIIVCKAIWFYSGWDVTIMDQSITSILDAGGLQDYQIDYLQTYPNNVFLYATVLRYYKIGFHFAAEKWILDRFLCYVCAAINSISVLFSGLCVYRLTDSKILAYIGWGIAGILIGLSPWMVIPYTDSLALTFPVIFLFLYLITKEKVNPNVRIMILAVVSALGYMMKPTCIIFFLGFLFTELFFPKELDKKGVVRTLERVLLTLVFFVCTVTLLSRIAYSYLHLEKDDTKAFSWTHYLMMGASYEYNGIVNIDDYDFSHDICGKSERQRANLEKTYLRIHDMGVRGYVNHLVRKTLVNYSNGTFAWGDEGNWMLGVPNISGRSVDLLRNIFYRDGAYYCYFATLEQFMWISVLILCFVAGLKNDACTQEKIMLQIILIGVFLFVSLFEARARYLYIYAPIFIVFALSYGRVCIAIKDHVLKKSI